MHKLKYELIGQNDGDDDNDGQRSAAAKTTGGENLFKFGLCCLLLVVVVLYKTPANSLSASEENVVSYFDNKTEMETSSSTSTKYGEEISLRNSEENSFGTSTASTTDTKEKTSSANIFEKYNFNSTAQILEYFSTTVRSLTSSTPKPVKIIKTTTATKSTNTTTRIPPSVVTAQWKPQPQVSRKYYVNTTHCKMPYVDPFTPALRKMFKPGKPANCAKDPAIVSEIYNATSRRYSLHLNTLNAKKIGHSDVVSCCYREIVRSGKGGNADKKYTLLPCANFHQDFEVPVHIDALIVDCYVNATTKSKKLLQQDAFSFVQEKAGAAAAKKPGGTRKPNVMLIGIDTLSRMNFRRNMPKTFNYIERHDNWFELQGYNKMGDNTFPNLMALLTSYNSTNAYDKCKPKMSGGLDNCPFIWQKYKAQGYRTAYAEDLAGLSTFNYLKKGFTKPPTDHYLRPMVLAIEKSLKVTKKNGLANCIGRKQYGEYIYDYALQFANYYKDEPMFGLFWTNSFSHNSYDASSSMDGKMLEYLRAFELNGHLENSIVVFFSDHGCRWGSLLKLPEGFLEERLPMFFISLPQWFRQQHPDFVQALDVNRNRLTSPYDVYMTLQHILELNEPELKLPQARDCAKCQSVFRQVPEDRSCADVGVSEHWCTCVPYQTLSTKDKLVKSVTDLVIAQMNQYLANKNLSLSHCRKLELKSIKEAYLKLDEDAHEPESTYRLKYTANPKEASFQATAKYDPVTKTVAVDVESISRLDSYASVSKCIDDKEAKKYCICKDVHTGTVALGEVDKIKPKPKS